MADASFAGKFMKRIRKLDSEQIEAFLSNVLREKAFLEVILDSITEGVFVTEQGMKLVYINEPAAQFIGIQREAAGRSLLEVLPAGPLLDLAREYALAQEPIDRREIPFPGQRIISVNIQAVENEDHIATHSVWILSDRTEIIRRQKEHAQMENLESLAVLTAGVAHEVKNPLNSLNIHAQLLFKATRDLVQRCGEDPAAERMEKSTSVILEEIQRLKHVVDNFIKAVRPVKPHLKKNSINKVILSLAELLGPDCARQDIDLTLNLDPEVPASLMDPEQMHQALLNIIKNAVEAIEERPGQVSIRTQLKSDHVLIEIEDDGVGIPDDDRMRIFEPYHSTKFHGTGLGLVLVYRIVKAHRGAIGLQSTPGVGTVFSIALPLNERPVRLLPSHVQPPMTEPVKNRGKIAEEA